ncbi:Sec20-domain-containing protein [Phanerochaete sordida]|uniref:Sec20-domain-containing protein n=1 Tax=Phanerochaete sordida TaxID=48140 RepID=A0A9P3FZK2_9APHY|nr:Sec20-domain-containing protein [Phanerochaete sordida]
MPPLPVHFDDTTKTTIESLERRQKDLREFQIPRLRTCKGPLSVQQQYAAEIREDIDVFAKQLESLDIAVDDQNGERSRKELRRIVDEYKGVLASMRKESRAALLASKRAIDASGTSNREELLRSAAVNEKQNFSEQVAEDSLMTASNNVTEALQRTMALMQGELENLLVTSKHLVTALEKSDWLDRMLIIAALLFFILVILFILKQRLVDRSLRLALWWTRFIPSSSKSRAAEKIVDAMEKGSVTASSSVAEAASIIATAVSVVATTSTLLATSITGTSSVHDPDPTGDSMPPMDPVSTDIPQKSVLDAIAAEPTEDADDLLPSPTDIIVEADTQPLEVAHDEL